MQTMVRMGELAVSDEAGHTLISLGLGSCIGLALLDRRGGKAGLAHIVLPTSAGHVPGKTAYKFADHAIPALIGQLAEMGAPRVRLHAMLVGGASMFGAPGSGTLEVGSRNAAAVRELLAAQRIPVVAEAVGGSRGRTIRVDVQTGGVTVREAGGKDAPLLPNKKSMAVAA
jgi:chemotaxis protein CheD